MDVIACPGCGEENPSRFRLCGFCGTPLAPPASVLCPSCGEENPGRFRMCGFCGTSLVGAAPTSAPAAGTLAASPPLVPPASPATPAIELASSEVRKPATFIFVDLKGSTALTERIDQEAMSEIKKRYFSVMAAQIEQHGGTIEKYIGDAIMAVFGIPKAREDDALRAVRAAYGMQQQLVDLNRDFLRFYGVELANRTGVNTGEVVANTDPTANQQLATGDTVNVAARLEQAAPPNEILIGETTYDLVRGHVTVEAVEPLELKGKSERVAAYRLIALVGQRDAEVAAQVSGAPLVGRGTEWEALQASFAEAVATASSRLVTVMGDPGVGKTRLVRDFTTARSVDARVLRGRCLPYGDGITFWPLKEVVRDAAAIADEDDASVAQAKLRALLAPVGEEADQIAERVASAIGLSSAQFPVTELMWGGRRLLEIIAADQPVVVVIDDLHLAQPTFLDFLATVQSASRGVPILLLTTARHALVEHHPDWSDRAGGLIITLGPLSADDTAGLANHLLGGDGLDDTIREKVVRAADGNPLFVEQMVSMLVDKGVLQRVDGRWLPARSLEDIAVPATIQALLAARLDDLSREERVVVEPASVIGLVFFEPAIQSMVPMQLRPAVPANLGSLDDKQFVARDAEDPDEGTYRFRHGMIREATYNSLLKRARATLHEQFVAWAEPVNRERGREQEFEEILGFHLEQAYRYRTELGPIDDQGRALAKRAAEKLGASGRRAFARGDLTAAVALLRRTAALLEDHDHAGIAARIELAEALAESGEFGAGSEVLDGVDTAAMAIGDALLAARSRLARITIGTFSGEIGEGGMAAAQREAEAAVDAFQTAGDEAGEARATRVISAIHAMNGRYDEAAQASERAVELATRTGDKRLASRGAASYASFALAGPTPVADARYRCTVLLEQVAGDRKAEATILVTLAVAEAMLGDVESARGRHAAARTILGELGRSVTSASTSIEGSRVEVLAGNLEAAEALLRADDAELAAYGERYFRSTVSGLLANVLEARRSDVDAARYIELARELADEEDSYSQALWRIARAKLLARTGEPVEAERSAREAVELVDETGDLDFRGDLHADLGLVLARIGQVDAAKAELLVAARLYEEKGDIMSVALVDLRMEEVRSLPAPR